MPVSLLELQRAFRQGVINGDCDALSEWVLPVGKSTERIAVYRNNIAVNLRNALRADYPVVEKLVGAEFFLHAADAYIAAHASPSGDVTTYGARFPAFLAAFAPAESLPYLPDVARLEQAWNEAFLAPEAAPGDFSGLAALPAERFAALRFMPHPALRLLSSPYPVLQIWRANQPGCDGDVSLDAGGECVLIRRVASDVELRVLPSAERAWLASLAAGEALEQAVEAACALDEHFDLLDALRRHVAEATFIACLTGERS